MRREKGGFESIVCPRRSGLTFFVQMSWQKFIPVEVYPLVGAVGVGLGLSVYAGHHMLTHNADVNPKLGGARYSWERFDKDTVLEPHFRFLEGQKANERRVPAAQRHEAREKH